MIPQFQNFREMLLHCFRCRDNRDSRQALEIIDDYLNDPRASRPHEPFWSEHNIQQALGFRIAFLQDIDPTAVIAAEDRHLHFCVERLQYWLNATADSYARLAMAHFNTGDYHAGREATKEAIRLAGLLEAVSPAVAEAAAKMREGERHG